jgi:hypothetical protein
LAEMSLFLTGWPFGISRALTRQLFHLRGCQRIPLNARCAFWSQCRHHRAKEGRAGFAGKSAAL